jgi:hypothetical protein
MAINDPGTSVGTPVGGLTSVADAAREAVQAGISTQALDQAKQAAQGLKDAAASGQLRITPEGFDILINALNQCDDHIRSLNFALQAVTQAPMLGSSPYAQTVAAHVQKGGTGEAQSADAVIQQISAVFDATRDALNRAKQAYEENEQATVRKLK